MQPPTSLYTWQCRDRALECICQIADRADTTLVGRRTTGEQLTHIAVYSTGLLLHAATCWYARPCNVLQQATSLGHKLQLARCLKHPFKHNIWATIDHPSLCWAQVQDLNRALDLCHWFVLSARVMVTQHLAALHTLQRRPPPQLQGPPGLEQRFDSLIARHAPVRQVLEFAAEDCRALWWVQKEMALLVAQLCCNVCVGFACSRRVQGR